MDQMLFHICLHINIEVIFDSTVQFLPFKYQNAHNWITGKCPESNHCKLYTSSWSFSPEKDTLSCHVRAFYLHFHHLSLKGSHPLHLNRYINLAWWLSYYFVFISFHEPCPISVSNYWWTIVGVFFSIQQGLCQFLCP